MQLYHSLPATDYSWAAASIKSVRQLRGPKQRAVSQIVLARMELARLVVFSAIELGAHIAAAAAKTAAAIIQLPLRPLFGGVTSRAAIVDAGAHLARAAKLAPAILCAPVLGLARPEWSLDVFQRLSLVKESQGRFAAAITAAWNSRYRNHVLVTAALAIATIAIGRRHLLEPIDQGWSRLSSLGVFAGIAGIAATIIGVVRCRQARYSPENVITQHTVLTRYAEALKGAPINNMANRPNETGIVVTKGASPRVLEVWSKDDTILSSSDMGSMSCYALMKDGNILFSTNRGFFMKSPNGQFLGDLEGNGTFVTCIEQLSDQTIAAGHMDGSVQLLPSNGLMPKTLIGLTGQVSVITNLPDGGIIAGTLDVPAQREVAIWNKRNELVRVLNMNHLVYCLEPSTNGQCFATSFNSAVGILSLDGTVVATLGAVDGRILVNIIKWLSNGLITAGYTNGDVRIWNHNSGQEVAVLRGHTGSVYQIREDNSGGLITSSRDGTTRLWPLSKKPKAVEDSA